MVPRSTLLSAPASTTMAMRREGKPCHLAPPPPSCDEKIPNAVTQEAWIDDKDTGKVVMPPSSGRARRGDDDDHHRRPFLSSSLLMPPSRTSSTYSDALTSISHLHDNDGRRRNNARREERRGTSSVRRQYRIRNSNSNNNSNSHHPRNGGCGGHKRAAGLQRLPLPPPPRRKQQQQQQQVVKPRVLPPPPPPEHPPILPSAAEVLRREVGRPGEPGSRQASPSPTRWASLSDPPGASPLDSASPGHPPLDLFRWIAAQTQMIAATPQIVLAKLGHSYKTSTTHMDGLTEGFEARRGGGGVRNDTDASKKANNNKKMGDDDEEHQLEERDSHRTYGKYICRYCGQLYWESVHCPVVAGPTHRELRRQRRREKVIKKRAQALLRRGAVAEAIALLRDNDIVSTSMVPVGTGEEAEAGARSRGEGGDPHRVRCLVEQLRQEKLAEQARRNEWVMRTDTF